MATHLTRGDRGDVLDTRSLTAQKYQQGLNMMAAQGDGIRRTRNALSGAEPVTVVEVGDRTYVIPRAVMDFLTAGESE
jgi:hypothetical protein